MTLFSKGKYNFLFPAAILLAGFILYLPSVRIPFLNDELAFISRNQADSFTSLLDLFSRKSYDGDYYRPVVNFISGILSFAAGYNAVFYRFFNLLLHSVNGLLVYSAASLLLEGNKRKELIAFFGALLFISSPINDYAVIWHTDLFDRIMMFFYLLSLIWFIRAGSWGYLSLIFFLLSALSKEMAFSLPFIILMLSVSINGREQLTKAVKDFLPYFILLIILLVFRWLSFDNNIFALKDAHSAGTPADVIKNVIFFTGMLIFPFFLREIQELIKSNLLVFLVSGGILILSAFYYILRKKRKDFFLILMIFFILITILPASRLLMRWYLYLPSAGFALLLSYLMLNGWPDIRKGILSVLIVFVIYYSYTIHRETRWIEVAGMGRNAVVNLKEQITGTDKNELIFLTVPAKVDDIPLFQLGFDHHLRIMLGIDNKISVLSKSYLESPSALIETNISPGDIMLSQTGDNYFMLSDIGKNIKFSDTDINNNKLKNIHFINNKEPYKTLFTFSEGKFQIIKE